MRKYWVNSRKIVEKLFKEPKDSGEGEKRKSDRLALDKIAGSVLENQNYDSIVEK